MSFLKKLWKDRVTEYPNRRILTDEDGTETLVSVARSEGNISEVGDAFSAENMNDLEDRIGNEFDAINNSLDSINKCKLLTTVTSTSQTNIVTVDNIAKYREIKVCGIFTGSGYCVNECVLPIDIFKTLPIHQICYNQNDQNYFVHCEYISDTSLKVYSEVNLFKVSVYGVY